MTNFTVHEVPGPSSEKEIEEHHKAELIHDWAEDKNINYRKFQKGSSMLGRMVGFLFALVAAVGLAWFGVQWLFSPDGLIAIFDEGGSSSLEKKALALEVNAPSEIASGDQVLYEIVYTNNENYVLSDIELIVRYPENFNFEKSETVPPFNANHNVWELGSIAPGESKKIEIFGQLLGDEGEVKEFIANLTYKPVNFHARFKETKKAETVLKSSVLSLEIEGPKNLLKEQEAEYIITAKNNALEQLNNVELKIALPSAFEVSEALPKREDGVDSWRFEWIEPQAEKKVTIKGVARGSLGESKIMQAEIGVTENGVFRLQNRASLISAVIDPSVILDLAIETSEKKIEKDRDAALQGDNAPSAQTEKSDKDQITAPFSSELFYAVRYENKSDLELINIVIELEIVDIQRILDEKGFVFQDGQKPLIQYEKGKGIYHLTWGGKGAQFLKDLKPNDSDTLNFTATLLGEPKEKKEDVSYSFRSKLKLAARSQDVTAPIVVEGNSVVVDVE